jgi:hypothetical protein
MTSDLDGTQWLASVLRSELPIRQAPRTLSLDARAGTWCEGAYVGATLVLRAPNDPALPFGVDLAAGVSCRVHFATREGLRDRARSEAYVRAWCAVVRRALRDLATSDLPDAPLLEPGALTAHAVWAVSQRTALRTLDDFTNALSGVKALGRFLAIAPARATAALDCVHTIVNESPPLLETPTLRLTTLTTPWNDEPPPGPSRGGVRVHYGGVVVAIELCTLLDDVIVDRKQQEIELCAAEHLGDLARVEHYLRAWREVLPEHAALFRDSEIDYVMPHDLAAPEVLGTRRAKTREHFCAAFARHWHFTARKGAR